MITSFASYGWQTVRDALRRATRVPQLSRSDIVQLGACAGGVMVFAFLITHSIAPYFAAGPKPGAPEAEFKADLDRAAPGILRHFGVPGVVVATVVDGAPSHTYAYGLADVEHHRPMTPDTVFHVASLSKSLTAWGVLRLVEAGKVDLDKPARQYLAHWPLPASRFPADAVTVRRLLNHTAGLSPGGDTFRQPGQTALSPEALLAGHGSGDTNGPASLVEPAGQSFLYSVPGYMMLQMLVEQQSGRPFTDYMKSSVLQPLGMASSSFDGYAGLRTRTATAYDADGKPMAAVVPEDVAADSLFATAGDMARFIAAPLPDRHLPAGGDVLSADLASSLYDQPGPTPSRQYPGFGPDIPSLGCFIENLPGHVIVTNGGTDPGWLSRYYIAPATGDGIVVLVNSARGQPAIAQLVNLWAGWRGLPPSNIISAYRTLGVEASVAIGLLAMLGLSFAAELLFQIAARERRLGAFDRLVVRSAVLEVMLVSGVLIVWTAAHSLIRDLPTLDLVGGLTVGLLSLAVLARLIAPVHTLSAPAARREPEPSGILSAA